MKARAGAVLRRMAGLVATLLVTSLLVFSSMYVAPGDPIDFLIQGRSPSPEAITAIKAQYGLEAPWDHLPIAVIAVHRGRLEVARSHSERALQLGEEQIGLHTPVHLGTLGVVARQSGDLEAAAEWFAEAEAQTTRLGWHEASRRWWVGDHVETLLELDRADEAVRVLDAWEAEA